MLLALNQWEGCSFAYRVIKRQKMYAWIRQIPTSNKIYAVWILSSARNAVREVNSAALV